MRTVDMDLKSNESDKAPPKIDEGILSTNHEISSDYSLENCEPLWKNVSLTRLIPMTIRQRTWFSNHGRYHVESSDLFVYRIPWKNTCTKIILALWNIDGQRQQSSTILIYSSTSNHYILSYQHSIKLKLNLLSFYFN